MDEKILKLERLEKQLKVMMNQHKMLSDTLYEMVNRGVDNELISRIKDEMNETLDEVNSLKEEIEEINGKTGKATNIYDSIKKAMNSVNETMDSMKKTFDENDLPNQLDSIRILDDLGNNKLYHDLPFSNRFLVDLDDLGIDSWMVKSFAYAPSGQGHKIFLTIYNHIIGIGPGKYPLYELLDNSRNDEFSIKVTYLDPTGVPIYSEEYVDCKIVECFKSPLTYDVGEPTNVEITLEYGYVKYDVNIKEEDFIARKRRINKKRR
jgi:hypothetical protein